MKRFIVANIFVLVLVSMGFAGEPDIEKHRSCTYCGMDREKFAQSRMLIDYDDGTSVGVCSLHCAAVELANSIDKSPRSIGVGDFRSRKLIDAEKAFWVVGGSKPGVMTGNAKWAFESKADAEKMIQESGGRLASFEEAIKAAYEDMYTDTKRIRERRTMKRSVGPQGHAH